MELIKNVRGQVKFKDFLKGYDEILAIYEENLNTLKNSGQAEERPIMTRIAEDIKLNTAAVGEMQKKFKISEKMMFIAKVKAYCENPTKDNIDRLDLLLKNKYKKDFMPYFDLATLLYEKGLMDKAEIYAAKIPDFDDQIMFLKTMETPNSLKLAAESAISNKKMDRVLELEKILNNLKSNGKKIDDEIFTKINKYKGGK